MNCKRCNRDVSGENFHYFVTRSAGGLPVPHVYCDGCGRDPAIASAERAYQEARAKVAGNWAFKDHTEPKLDR